MPYRRTRSGQVVEETQRVTEMNKNKFLHGKFSIVRTLLVAAIAAPIFLTGFIYVLYKMDRKYMEPWHRPYQLPPYARKLSPEEQARYNEEEEWEDREAQQKALEVKKQP